MWVYMYLLVSICLPKPPGPNYEELYPLSTHGLFQSQSPPSLTPAKSSFQYYSGYFYPLNIS